MPKRDAQLSSSEIFLRSLKVVGFETEKSRKMLGKRSEEIVRGSIFVLNEYKALDLEETHPTMLKK